MLDRRSILIGAGVAGVQLAFGRHAAVAATATPASPFAGTAVEANPLAKLFQSIDRPLPAIALRTAAGKTDLSRLRGKTRLVTLWAEWCVPCLIEARDLADLQRTYGGETFDIVSVLTASAQKLDYAGALARLDKAGAGGLPLLIEANGGKRVAEAFSPGPGRMGLPCTLLVDANGRVRARALGAPIMSSLPMGSVRRGPDGKPLPMRLTEAEKQQLSDGSQRSLWSSADGKTLIAALSNGVLR
ncbi:TlpA family protein disulfide reductase [Sphingomonas oligophenolica]|uniref:TlpA family protein disulfide reductase n=1 Tax=Sphingomonas oligophenolica TaxID=301154 RepID=A0A502CP91_9SPHN|nr:TlpA disulfide reductase family protein [Sphingomonas oligophenolica]TPG13606.1 TlpA family protein disulfide reductase [Sphingomonas oligophenolica]